MKKNKFQPKTVDIINKLKAKIDTKTSYPTLGHFYREIELLKFPWLADVPPLHYYYSKTGRNVYSQQQYDTIVDYCVSRGWVSIEPNVNHKGRYIVYTHVGRQLATGITRTKKEISKEQGKALQLLRNSTYGAYPTQPSENEIKVELTLDPNLEWIVKTENGKSYLTVKK